MLKMAPGMVETERESKNIANRRPGNGRAIWLPTAAVRISCTA